MTTIVSWNIGGYVEPWEQLLAMDADVAILQEVTRVPPEVASRIELSPYEPWNQHLYDRFPMVVKLSDRVSVEWFRQVEPISYTGKDELAVSGIGHIDVARVTPNDGEPIFAFSMYGRWMRPHHYADSNWILSDLSVHRIVSDLSAFIGRQNGHRIIASGDLNILYGHGENGSKYWAARYQTVFDRMEALGMRFVGPQFPNGRQADPWPNELPRGSNNVPTFFPSGKTPATATRQLDFAFASRGLHESVTVRAMNGVDEWGPSDHCRVLIEVKEG